MRARLACFVNVCLLGMTMSVMAADDSAFAIDERDFKKNYKVIALSPPDAEAFLQMPDAVATMLEEEVTARLQKRGFTVISSAVLAGIRKTMEQQVGGYEDPETGRVDIAKMRAVREHGLRELWFRQQIDAVGMIRVSVVRVPMESDRVEWDGTKQKIEYSGRSQKYSATIAVSSVSVGFYDASNRLLFLNYGGLEPLMHRTETQLEPLSADRLFKDEKLIRKAAQIAVDPI